MLLKISHSVKLPKTYYKILYLYPAMNDTFVFLGMRALRQDCITHVDKNGNILFEHVFSKPMDTLNMMTERQCIMLETRGKWYMSASKDEEETGPCITVLDLDTYQFTRTPHYFLKEETEQSFIRCFPDTKILCIQEDGCYNDNRFMLSYYQYPLTPQSKSFNKYTSKDDEWTYEYLVRQANNHSMMAWFKARHDNQWRFKTYDLRQNPEGKYNEYVIKQEMGLLYNINNFQVAMLTMWQTKKNCFMFVCNSNKTDQHHKSKQLGVVQNIFICDTQTNTVRQAKFSFNKLQDQLIDQTYLGTTSMFRTFDFREGKPAKTPIFFIQNETEEIVAMDEWTCSYLHKDESTGVESGLLVHNMYENGDCDNFVCETVKVATPKEIYLHFLLSINRNFDEDLLHDVIEIINYEL